MDITGLLCILFGLCSLVLYVCKTKVNKRTTRINTYYKNLASAYKVNTTIYNFYRSLKPPKYL